jgi:hypothetical protein
LFIAMHTLYINPSFFKFICESFAIIPPQLS